jgi:hypothetical protein
VPKKSKAQTDYRNGLATAAHIIGIISLFVNTLTCGSQSLGPITGIVLACMSLNALHNSQKARQALTMNIIALLIPFVLWIIYFILVIGVATLA